MHVILLSDVPNVGRKYDVKIVSDGYASNFLLPRKLAEPATPKRLEFIKKMSAQVAQTRELKLNLLERNLAQLKGVHVHITARASEAGHLYEGIRAAAVIKALAHEHHLELPEEALILEHPLKAIGEHHIPISHHGHTATLTVVIAPSSAA